MSTNLILPDTDAWFVDAADISVEGEAALGREACAFGVTFDGFDFDGFEHYSRFYRYDKGRWVCVEVEARIVSMMPYREPGSAEDGLAIVTREGGFFVLGSNGYQSRVNEAEATMLSRLKMLGGELHVAGYGGQVYRRGMDGWHHDDKGMLDAEPPVPRPRPSDRGRGSFSVDDLVVTPDGRDHYACGRAYIARPSLFWRSSDENWRWLGLDAKKSAFDFVALNRLYAETPDHVWISTNQGILLMGNGRDGFQTASETGRDENGALSNFSSIVRYGDHLFVGGSTVCRLLPDGKLERQIGPPQARMGEPKVVRTTIDGTLEVADGVLWAFGYGVLSRFDGKVWERIPMPSIFRYSR